MKTIASSDLQSRFGEILDMAKRDPVTVTQYGRPVVTMMNYEDAQEAIRLKAGQSMMNLLDSIQANPAACALSEEEVNRLVHDLRP